MNFGKRLRELRSKRGLSQEELAYRINEVTKGRKIKRNTISHYENSVSHPDFYTLLALGQVLISTMDFLMVEPTAPLLLEEGKAEYIISEPFSKMEMRIHEIESMAETDDVETLQKLLAEAIAINKKLIEHATQLYKKTKEP